MLIKTMPLGQLETNCYIVTDEDTLACAIIDPGDEANVVLDYLEEHGFSARVILITHGHFDHTAAVGGIVQDTGAKVYIHRKDSITEGRPTPYQYFADGATNFYGEGDKIEAGNLTFSVMETPGHSPGSVTLRCGDALFTGDALFKDSCGRTDLPGGDMDVLMASLRRLYHLDGDFEVYPGHADSSTMDRERRFNYYLKYAVEAR